MKTQDWLNKVKENQEILTNFIAAYYPNNYFKVQNKEMPITAGAVEKGCVAIRKEIAENTFENPVITFERAIKEEDVDVILSHLNSAWFGVPESTSCWGIKGFKEAVDLLEETPDDYE